MMNFIAQLKRRLWEIGLITRELQTHRLLIDEQRIALGRIEARQLATANSLLLAENEFSVFSQWGEDGIIQFLLRHVPVKDKRFVEFGVESYIEANTRFLLVKDNWSGLIMDGSDAHMASVRRDPIYWRHNLKAVSAFITRENINVLLRDNGFTGEIGLLSVDVDGMDYWIWEAIDAVTPAIVIAEYNSLFGADRAVTIPYDSTFVRSSAHHSCTYYGASLSALVALGNRKGYAFMGCNSAGNNAFFVLRSLLPSTLKELSAAEGFIEHQFREARDENGRLTFSSHAEDAKTLETLPLVEVPA